MADPVFTQLLNRARELGYTSEIARNENDNRRIKSIRTEYRGLLFRSKLEADFAWWLDNHKVPWTYEPEAFDLGGVHYLPDFYLYRDRLFVEVKGLFDLASVRKVEALARALYEIKYVDFPVDDLDQPGGAELPGVFNKDFVVVQSGKFGEFGLSRVTREGISTMAPHLLQCVHCSRYGMGPDGRACASCSLGVLEYVSTGACVICSYPVCDECGYSEAWGSAGIDKLWKHSHLTYSPIAPRRCDKHTRTDSATLAA